MNFIPWIPIIMMIAPFLIFAFVVWIIFRAVTLPFKRDQEEARSVKPRLEKLKAEVDSLRKEIEELKKLTAGLSILVNESLTKEDKGG